MRTCSICKETKPEPEFARDRTTKSGYSNRCKPCGLEKTKAYQAANPEKVLATRKKSRAKHREKLLAARRDWGKRNREHRKAYAAAYYAANKTKFQRYHQENPERYREAWRRYQAKKIAQDGVETPGAKAHILERQGGRCAWCGNEDGPFELDHVQPVSKGGFNDDDNFQVLCRTCNRSKGSRIALGRML